MKKIGFVTPWFGENIPGGAEMATRELASHLYDSGIDIEVLTTCVEQFASDWNRNHYQEGLDTVAGVPVRRFAVKKRDTTAFDSVNYKLINRIPVSQDEEKIFLREMVNSPELYDYMKKHSDDYSIFIFIPYMFGTTYYGIHICPEKSVLIPCFHDEGYARMGSFRKLFPKACGMIFLSTPENEFAHNEYDLSGMETSVLGVGLDTDVDGNSDVFRKKYSINSPFIVYAGRKDTGKNVHTLLSYFERYKSRHPGDLRLVLIGGGNIEIPAGIKNFVDDLGFVSVQDKYDACAAAEFLCQPSLNESFSLVIMESWLCGRPVLVHGKCAVTKNFAIESNGGLYFDGFYEFEGCVEYLLSHPQEANAMGHMGKRFVLDNFSWDVIVKRYTEFFRRVIVE